MRTLVLAVALAAPLAVHAQSPQQPAPHPPAPLGNEVGFFKPAADPALTAIRPAPRAPQAPSDAAGSDEMTREIRAAEQARLDRAVREQAAREHADTHALASEVPKQPPPVGSPLDGTAPILSPLDGSAPILTPLGR